MIDEAGLQDYQDVEVFIQDVVPAPASPSPDPDPDDDDHECGNDDCESEETAANCAEDCGGGTPSPTVCDWKSCPGILKSTHYCDINDNCVPIP